jgi:hypothetical protein
VSGVELRSVEPDLVGTCAFLAAHLAGVPARFFDEGGVARGFQVLASTGQDRCVVWDPKRWSFVHVRPEPDSARWRAYDFASAQYLRAVQEDDEFTFTAEADPTWLMRARLAGQDVHVAGPNGEQCFRLGAHDG